MKKITVFLLLSFFLLKSIFGTNDCLPASCSPTGPPVRFPFRIRDRQSPHCGFPGFDLSCTKRNRTILHLAPTRSYIVNRISYREQIIYINPEFCRPNRIVDFSLTGTPFDFSSNRSYTFYNCSLRKSDFDYKFPAMPLQCMDNANNSVIVVNGSIPEGDKPEDCEDIAVVSVPIRWYGDVEVELALMWVTTFCRYCELEGRVCGVKGSDGEPTCLGIQRSTYGLFLVVTVSILICMVAVVWYIADKRRDYNQSLHQNTGVFSVTIASRQRASTGLDMSIIESYTKTTLGESRRLPKDDDTCPICLSKYEPKDTLRTIPECNHYFHVDCIDEWLRLNATCPICRNSP